MITRTGSALLAMLLGCPLSGVAQGLSVHPYGSLRVQAEAVRPDNRAALGAYTGLRDAYSRIGVSAEYEWGRASLFGQLELPLDAANVRLRDPYDQGGFGRADAEDRRIARVGVRTTLGTLAVGQQWTPYYNAIAATVDRFSTYYSGFATYGVSRLRDTLSYASPDINGLTFAASYTPARGNRKSTSRIDDRRLQATLSYAFGAALISAAVDDRGHPSGLRDRLYGVSASYTVGNLYLGAKMEMTDTSDAGAFYGDGARAINLLGEYAAGRNTYKLMLARLENYGENIVHVGVDHQYDDALVLFAEFYREQETAALTPERRGLAGLDREVSGGKVFAAGVRYTF